jgi:DNA-binding transcriptional MerR regulator
MEPESPESRPPITTSDVARLLGRSVDRVRQLERAGKISCVRTASGMRLFDPAEAERFAEQRRQAGGAKPA